MDRSELLAEIKAQIIAEMEFHRESLSQKIPDAQKAQAQEVKDVTTAFVKENPLAAVGIAAAIGFLLARFFYRGDK